MPAYDLFMLLVLVAATIFGAIKGFAWQVASLASIVVSYFVAYNYRYDVAKMIDAKEPWNLFLAMLLLYAGTSFVIWIVFRLISGTIDKVRLKEFDRQLGAGFGLIKGCLFCLLITMFAMTLLDARKQQAICQSRSGYYISKFLASAKGLLPKEVEQVVGPQLRSLEEKLQNGGGQYTGTGLNGFGGTSGGVPPNENPNGSWLNGLGGITGQPSNFPSPGQTPNGQIANGLNNAISNAFPNGVGDIFRGAIEQGGAAGFQQTLDQLSSVANGQSGGDVEQMVRDQFGRLQNAAGLNRPAENGIFPQTSGPPAGWPTSAPAGQNADSNYGFGDAIRPAGSGSQADPRSNGIAPPIGLPSTRSSYPAQQMQPAGRNW